MTRRQHKASGYVSPGSSAGVQVSRGRRFTGRNSAGHGEEASRASERRLPVAMARNRKIGISVNDTSGPFPTQAAKAQGFHDPSQTAGQPRLPSLARGRSRQRSRQSCRTGTTHDAPFPATRPTGHDVAGKRIRLRHTPGNARDQDQGDSAQPESHRHVWASDYGPSYLLRARLGPSSDAVLRR